jgi:hypothetical protein
MFFHADVHPASACEFRPGSSCTSPWNHDNTAHERRSEYGESTWLKKIPMTRTRIHHFPVKVNSLHASALFPTKLSLDTLGLCCCLRIICETSLRPSGVTGAPQLQRGDFWHEFNPASQSCCYANTLPPSLLCCCSHPSLTVLFPCVKQRQG